MLKSCTWLVATLLDSTAVRDIWALNHIRNTNHLRKFNLLCVSASREIPPLPQQRQSFFKRISLLCHLQKHTFRVGSYAKHFDFSISFNATVLWAKYFLIPSYRCRTWNLKRVRKLSKAHSWLHSLGLNLWDILSQTVKRSWHFTRRFYLLVIVRYNIIFSEGINRTKKINN